MLGVESLSRAESRSQSLHARLDPYALRTVVLIYMCISDTANFYSILTGVH
jgi:hypothetical protein